MLTFFNHLIILNFTSFLAIESNDYAEANRLQMALMVDHTRQCKTWIPAIRQLINQHT